MESSTKRNTPRDVFLHLFSMVALYWTTIAFITLCWQYVNYFFPDIQTLHYGFVANAGSIRFAVASLIIIFPLFLLASWQLNRIYKKEVLVRESKIRKWLIYLTLFIAALIVMGDFVIVIYNFLGGDITIKFFLEALSVLMVAGLVFGYYLDDVRRPNASGAAKYVVWVSIVIVLLLIVGAFFIIGSPVNARLVQFDQQRVNDLQNIQSQIVNYWHRKGQLPATMTDLNDPISGYAVPNDPETGTPYEYAIQSASLLQFQLCARFSLPSGNEATAPAAPYPGGIAQNWDHAAGNACFNRQIDRQLYPPLNQTK